MLLTPTGFVLVVPAGRTCGLLLFLGVLMQRATAFIDGFNLYHAIDDLRRDHLKWLNLKVLAQIFAPPSHFTLNQVLYFSAYATWKPDSYRRHRTFVKALEVTGVIPIMGNFKEKDEECLGCGRSWKRHEEKETDVNIALRILKGAYDDDYDLAVVFSADSDLVPALDMIRRPPLSKSIKLVTPSNHKNCASLVTAAGGPDRHRRLRPIHIERCLLPATLTDPTGKVLVTLPPEWNPPPPSAPPATNAGQSNAGP